VSRRRVRTGLIAPALVVLALVMAGSTESGAQTPAKPDAPKALTGPKLQTAPKPEAQAKPEAKPQTQGKPPAQPRDDRSQPVTVDADRMERYGKQSLVVFTGNVVARQNNSVQYADRMEVYLDEKGDRILRTISIGGVRIITSDCRTGTALRAEYYDPEQRVVLIGNARVWQEDNVVSGDTITIFMSQDRSVVQGGTQERVKAVFYPKDEAKNGRPAKAAMPACEN
jgi:lipopolysaccharide export system protein LptA